MDRGFTTFEALGWYNGHVLVRLQLLILVNLSNCSID